jgi:hypothetical protein
VALSCLSRPVQLGYIFVLGVDSNGKHRWSKDSGASDFGPSIHDG